MKKIKSHGKAAIKKLLVTSFGNRVKSAFQTPAVIDLCIRDASPLEIFTGSTGVDVVFSIPVEKCIGFDELAFSYDSSHPYFLAAKEIVSKPQADYSSSILKKYYSCTSVRSASELLDIECIQNDALSAIEAGLPWRESSGPSVKSRRIKLMKSEAQQFSKHIDDSSYFNLYGPVPDERVELEFERIKSLVNSILRLGYHVESIDEHMTGVFLAHDNAYKVHIRGGQHRAAVLAALGYRELPVKIKRDGIVFREAVENWPGVTSGVVSIENALKIFDRVFASKQPKVINETWGAALESSSVC